MQRFRMAAPVHEVLDPPLVIHIMVEEIKNMINPSQQRFSSQNYNVPFLCVQTSLFVALGGAPNCSVPDTVNLTAVGGVDCHNDPCF